MICPRTGGVCKCSGQEICTLDIAFISLDSPPPPTMADSVAMVRRAKEKDETAVAALLAAIQRHIQE